MRIFTGSYNNCKIGNLVSISGDKGQSVNFTGNSYTKFAPKKEFWKIWHDNIGKISDEENNRFYMEEFYKQVLLKLNPKEVIKELEQFGNNIVLLCYENNNQFCHRHLVATWLEKKLKIKVLEISIDRTANISILSKNGEYVKRFNEIMDEIDQKQEWERKMEVLEIKKSKESMAAETLRVTQILKQAGVNIDKIKFTCQKNGKQHYILLKDIKQDGIDIKKIIEENGLNEDFKYGSRVLSLRKAYVGTGQCTIKEHEKVLAKELGLFKEHSNKLKVNRKGRLVEETIKVAQVLKLAGVHIEKVNMKIWKNDKQHYILLKDIKQDGIDIDKVIKDNGLDEDFNYGAKMTLLRTIYRGKANHPITENEKKLIDEIGIFKEIKYKKRKIPKDEVLSKKFIQKRLREDTIRIAYILKGAGVDLKRIPLTYIKDKKSYFVKLKEIIQLGINMNGIIEDYELDKNFEYGKGVKLIKQAYKTKNGLTEEQKEIVEELGLAPGKLEVRESKKQQVIHKNKQVKELYKQYEKLQRKEVNINEFNKIMDEMDLEEEWER